MAKLGLIREGKTPADGRVAFTPAQAASVKDRFDVEIIAQSSEVRSFKDQEYENIGIPVKNDLGDCDILMGIKEVPLDQLLDNKTYFFFSHTIKKQPYNQKLLQKILEQNITLIDYECLKNQSGQRLVAFGRYAGIVGAYNGIYAFGRRSGLFNLRRANQCFDMSDLRTEYQKVKLPPIKIAVTGSGRVAKGAMEVLDEMNIKKISVEEYLNKPAYKPCYVQLGVKSYHKTKDGSVFHVQDFYDNPSKFESNFSRFLPHTDLLISAAYWDPSAPRLFESEEMAKPGFKIKVIADITCDINGSIPSTQKASTIDEPLYDYNPLGNSIEPPLSDEKNITVMAIDNLPSELPRDSSQDFGNQLIRQIMPALLIKDEQWIIKRATITKGGELTEYYRYLQDYVEGE